MRKEWLITLAFLPLVTSGTVSAAATAAARTGAGGVRATGHRKTKGGKEPFGFERTTFGARDPFRAGFTKLFKFGFAFGTSKFIYRHHHHLGAKPGLRLSQSGQLYYTPESLFLNDGHQIPVFQACRIGLINIKMQIHFIFGTNPH